MKKREAARDTWGRIIEYSGLGYALLSTVTDSAGTPVDYTFTDTNHTFGEMLGQKASSFINRNITDVLLGIREHQFDWITYFSAVSKTGKVEEFEHYSLSLGKYFHVRMFSLQENTVVILLADISNQRQIAEISRKFIAYGDRSIDYQSICDQMLQFSGAKYAVFNRFNENGLDFTTVAVSGAGEHIRKAIELMGFNVVGKAWPHDPVRAEKIRDSVITSFRSLPDLTGETVSRRAVSLMERLFDIGQTNVVKITNDNRMLGDFTLIMARGQSLAAKGIVELFASLVGIFLEKKQAEIHSAARERNFRTFFDTLDDIVLIFDMEGNVLHVNRRAREKLGFSYSEMRQMRFSSFYHIDNQQEAEAVLRKLSPDAVETCPLPICRKDGTRLSADTRLWYGEWYGKPCIYGISKDISREQEALQKFNRLFERSPAMMAVRALPDGRFTEANAMFLETTGYSRDELLGRSADELGLYTDPEAGRKLDAEILNHKHLKNSEVQLTSKDYQQIYGLMSGEIFESQGVRNLLTVLVDITENKKKDKLLEVVTTITQDFLSTRNYHEVIPLAIQQMGGALDVSRVYLFENTFNQDGELTAASRIAEWSAAETVSYDDNPLLQQISVDSMNTMIASIRQDHPFSLNTEEMENEPAKAILKSLNIQSILVLPIMADNRFWGFLGFDECRYVRSWTELEMSILKVFSASLKAAVEREHADRLLIESEEKNRAILQAVPDMFFVYSPEGVIMDYFASTRSGHLFAPPEKFLNKSIIDVFPEDIAVPALKSLQEALRKKDVQVFEYALTIDGVLEYFEARHMPINEDSVLAISRNISDRKRQQDAISYLSYHDQLTNVYNRRYFETAMLELDTGENLPLSLIMLDVNGLKLINDAFGHLAGDELLKITASELLEAARPEDIVARIGGDEFVILLPGTDYEQTRLLAEELEKRISSKQVHSIAISISIGWDTKKQAGTELITVLSQAEEYMYRKKLTESRIMRHKAIEIIMDTLLKKKPFEMQHSQRVGVYCRRIGEALGLDAGKANNLQIAGEMHDIGKIMIDSQILQKDSSLTKSETSEMRRHVEVGYQIMKSVNEYAPLAEDVLGHHERWDGSGYPHGLKGEAIPLGARIIAVADAYDTMVSGRVYRKPRTPEEAAAELLANAGTQFDPDVVRVFIDQVR